MFVMKKTILAVTALLAASCIFGAGLRAQEVLKVKDNGVIETAEGTFDGYIGKGQYVLVDFWASWCGPCMQESPNVVKVNDTYKDKGLVVLGVLVNDKLEDSKTAIRKLGMKYDQVIDPENVQVKKFGITGIPHLILFGPDGEVVARGMRGPGIEAAVIQALNIEQ